MSSQQPAAGQPQHPDVAPTQSPAQAQQSFDRAMRMYEREEHLDDGR
jgi:hypothetical protein